MPNSTSRQRRSIRAVFALWLSLWLLLSASLPGWAQTPSGEAAVATQRATLKLILRVKPRNDPGRFDLQVNGETVAANVGHGGQSAAQPVRAGTHTVSTVAGGQTRLEDYQTSIVCKRDDGSDDDDDDDNDDDGDDGDDDDVYAQVAAADARIIARVNNATSLTLEVAHNDAVTCVITHQRRDGSEVGPELQITNSDNGVFAQAGGAVVYNLAYANTGNRAATGVVINETVPRYTQFNPAASTPGWDCRANACRYAVGTLAVGASGLVQFAVTLVNTLPADLPEIENLATLRDDGENGAERDLANNIASETTPFAGRPLLTATMQAQLALDADNNGLPSPGDTLEYGVVIANPTANDATGIIFTNRLVADVQLIAGSFQGDPGLRLAVDPQNERLLAVTLSNLPGGQQVAFRFQAAIRRPAAVSEIVNQGNVRANQLAAILTDDPTVPGLQDPTITPLDARPTLRVQMTDFLFLDRNNNEIVNAGDTLIYGVTIVNVGNQPTADVVLLQQPEGNTLLVAGSVYTNKGTVTTGNQPGDNLISIAIGSLAVGERVTVNFEMQVAGYVLTNQVANQSTVTLRDSLTGNPFTVVSDDPDTPPVGDPTVTPVTGAAVHLYMPAIARR